MPIKSVEEKDFGLRIHTKTGFIDFGGSRDEPWCIWSIITELKGIGTEVKQDVEDCFDHMFKEEGALLLRGFIPKNNKPSRLMANMIEGVRKAESRPNHVVREWTIGDWAKNRNPELVKQAIKNRKKLWHSRLSN